MSYFAVIREAGPAWTDGKGISQQPAASDHAAFMNALADQGSVLCAGPLAGSEDGRLGTPEFDHAARRQQVRVEGAELVHRCGDGERRVPLTTLEDARWLVAELVPHGPLSTEPLDVDPAAATRLGDWYAFAAAILGELADATATPVRLWPEHFDIAIEMGDEAAGRRANYGFSPGDAEHDEPYAYVGPWTADVSGELWRATGFRGAELNYSQLQAATDQHAAALDFFETRLDALA